MMAQSSWIANRIGHREGASYLLYIGKWDDPLYKDLQALLKTDELTEMGIEHGSVQTNSPNYANFARELGLRQDSLWTLTDNKGRRLLQGDKLPGATDLRNALDEAGIKSPIRVLRDFLKQHPGHLDARVHLLGRLREIAENRTRNALQLNIRSPRELGPNDPAFFSSEISAAFFGVIHVDTSQLEGARLNPEDDIKIWAAYAQELWTVFSSGDWRLIPMSIGQMPLEACSTTMIQIYRRHVPSIEAYIEELPSDVNLWAYYGWVTSITKQGSVKTMLDRLTPFPGASWPTRLGLNLLATEEAEKGDWSFLANTMTSNWPKYRSSISNPEMGISVGESAPDSIKTAFNTGRLDVIWQPYLKLLLESLIRTNRIADAETILSDVASIPGYGGVQRRAAELALHCDRSDLQTKWLALQIPEKPDRPDMDDLEADFYIDPVGITPRLVLINAEESDALQVDAMLGHGRINDWGVRRVIKGNFPSELMRRKEGWPEGVTYWGLFDSKSKLLAHGSGLPTEESLYQALDQFNVDTPANILRRFIREHPSHLEAKGELLQELKRLAENKTKEKVGTDAGLGADRVLDDEDDQAIWGEYARLYRQVLPYFLNQGRPQRWWWLNNPCASDFFIHSRTMKNLAVWMLPQVEESLRRQPTDEFLWGAWITMSDLIELPRLFRDLKETLTLSPMSNPLNLPPSDNRELLLTRYRARENWQGIIDVQEVQWERRIILGLTAESWGQYDLNSVWDSAGMQCLLEAYLRLDKNSEANEFIRIWSQSPVWGQIKQSAVGLAEKCGKITLAEQWKRIE